MAESIYDVSYASWQEAIARIDRENRGGSELIFRADHLSIFELKSSFDSEAVLKS